MLPAADVKDRAVEQTVRMVLLSISEKMLALSCRWTVRWRGS